MKTICPEPGPAEALNSAIFLNGFDKTPDPPEPATVLSINQTKLLTCSLIVPVEEGSIPGTAFPSSKV